MRSNISFSNAVSGWRRKLSAPGRWSRAGGCARAAAPDASTTAAASDASLRSRLFNTLCVAPIAQLNLGRSREGPSAQAVAGSEGRQQVAYAADDFLDLFLRDNQRW